MSEVKAVEAVDNALSALAVEERARVLSWAQLKYGPVPPATAGHQPMSSQGRTTRSPQGAGGGARTAKAKKSKFVVSMDKNLNLSPAGKASAVQFASAKLPTNVKQKCVVAVYYIREFVGLEKVTVQAVVTFFRHLSWPLPADPKNALQQAGTEGWLDTADSQDVKLTSLGENLVEHDLPKAKVK